MTEAEALDSSSRVLYLAIDDVGVAQDFLGNLLGPSGADVHARRAGSSWLKPSERAGGDRSGNGAVGFWSALTHGILGSRGPSVPQGDQLRRTREAVAQAVSEIGRVIAHDPPATAQQLWSELGDRLATIDLTGCVDLLSIGGARYKVSATEVTAVSGALRDAAAAMQHTRGRLGILRLRCES